MSVVTRFAPSPTGYLHLGHAMSAAIAWTRARQAGGRFLVRIEDIDPARCREAYVGAILEDLAWLGIDWDGLPLRQSSRLSLYRACLDQLAAQDLLYPCFCSRAEIRASAHAPHGSEAGPLYPGTCRSLSGAERERRIGAGAPHAWRLNMTRALAGAPPLTFTEEGKGETLASPAAFGDVILARRDAPASYHLCATCDDAAQGVTLVTRGEDLVPATHLHRLLQHLMGWPTPHYAHHPLLKNEAGIRLSKRDGARTLAAYRESGSRPETFLANIIPRFIAP